jgi:amidase
LREPLVVAAGDLADIDAVGQAELVHRGEVSPLELVHGALERIDRVEPELNAIVQILEDDALRRAETTDRKAPLAGVPMLLKDLIATCSGARHSEGSRFLAGNIARTDSTLVRRFRRAGLIVVGTSTTSEFGNASTTESAFLGPTRNPWDLGRTAGGSSGGSAAAVAAGMTPVAHGSDGGGSIRVPAACCGVFGLKPTRGRTPLGPEFGDLFGGLFVEHVLTRSVRDSAAILDAVSGPEPGDPHGPLAPERPFLDLSRELDPVRLRIGWSIETPKDDAVNPEIAATVTEAAKTCAALGHEVEEARPSYDASALAQAFFELWADGTAWLVDRWTSILHRRPDPSHLEPLTRALVEFGRRRSAADHLRSAELVQFQARRSARFFETFDVFLTPTLAELPVPLGWFKPKGDDPLEALELDDRFSPFTYFANATGQPAISIPFAWSGTTGLPIGVHAVARFGHEGTLLALAHQIEQYQPWNNRRPPVWAG